MRWISNACCVKLASIVLFVFAFADVGAQDRDSATIVDARHYSNVFGEMRNYRVFLPPSYEENSSKRYPVIYFFHGWSQRYFGSSNPYGDFDKGSQNGGDNIANFVSAHDVIVVKADGYNRSPDEPYYVRPYNVTPVETYRQFPIYFPELVEHIDTHYRTIADRAHRGISGLSMGGFMTFWIAGKYPHLVSAAGNFCGSAEFTVGPRDFPVEYRHLDMYNNYGGMNVRLHHGDKDFIRGYHVDLNKVWTQVLDNYSYKIFDAAHSTAGMGEMFSFLLKTFDTPPAKPAQWHHIDVYPEFSVWDYKVMTDRAQPGFTILENVDARGFRSAVREHLPDGTLMPSVKVFVKTPAIYERNQWHIINDFNTTTQEASQKNVKSDGEGRLLIQLDGDRHEIGVNKKSDRPNVSVTSTAIKGRPWATHQEEVSVAVTLLNKGMSPARNIRAMLTATRPGTAVVNGVANIQDIPVNGSSETSFTFRTDDDNLEMIRLKLTLRDDKKNEWVDYLDIPLKKKVAAINDFEVADGRIVTVVKSGIDTETIMLGHGNGDGIANPGESIVILIKDGDKLWRTDLTTNDPYVNPFGINVRKSDSWSPLDHVGASAKYDVPVVASDCPENHNIDFFVEYWQPEYPLHIIRQGTVKVNVRGEDTTPPIIGDVRATADNV
ncbi:MAG TPA: alpha/beta hydrolase-fold protein, partial [Chryseosolibacter sp.]|nr:alpha/beta hydrolase-fold protein [Chryseosolibacter sp.]